MTTPRLDGFHMPPEWAPHTRTWMEFPSANFTFTVDDGWLDHCRGVWASVANTIARFEPVSLVCNLGEVDIARALVSENVTLYETPTGDAWCRDSGPTFLVHPDGRLGAVHWTFNGWGDRGFSDPTDEQHVGGFIAGLAGAEIFRSAMVNEGGGIHVDGDGTVLVTETVQLDTNRNPDWNGEQVDLELKSYLGIEKAIWLPRGLSRDYGTYGTNGHVDICACFVEPGLVLAHSQLDPAHPDFEVTREYIAMLRAATDSSGRPLRVVEVPAPATLTDEEGFVDWSYLNHYVCNGAVVLCSFDDANDDVAADILSRVYAGREIVLHDARDIFACGGGIHCITQQEPAPLR